MGDSRFCSFEQLPIGSEWKQADGSAPNRHLKVVCKYDNEDVQLAIYQNGELCRGFTVLDYFKLQYRYYPVDPLFYDKLGIPV